MKTRSQTDATARASRRQFTRVAATAILAAPTLLAAGRSSRAQTPPASKPQAPAPPNPQPTPAAAQKPSPLAEAYAEVARTRFGDHIKPEEMEQLKRDFEGYVRTSERLRAYKLKNADEPDFVFRA